MRLLKIILFFLVTVNGFSRSIDTNQQEKPFVVLIASYNNEKYARDNMISALNQHYSNYRVIFINDCSSDNTLKIVQDTVREYRAEDKVLVIDNKIRKLGLRNYYEAIVNYTKNEEIIINLDGDDFLANKNVLYILNKFYSNPKKEIWLTYGQFVGMNSKSPGWNVKIPKDVIENSDYRNFPHVPTHLRTFYSWLFKKISINDLIYKDNFFEMTWDCAFMFPMLEMSAGRFTLIDKILYLYNDNNPINDHKVNVELQRFYANYIRSLRKYKPLKHSIFNYCTEEDCIICNKNISHEIYQ